MEEFLCGERDDEKKEFSWTHGSLRAGPGFHTKQLAVAASLCREPAGGLCVTSELTHPTFPTGDEFHPPAISTAPRHCPAPSTTHISGVDPLGDDGQSLD